MRLLSLRASRGVNYLKWNRGSIGGAVAGEIGALRCIRFAGLRDGDAEYVKRSAVHELGRRNVYVDVVARSESPPLNDVFIIPRALVANLLLEAGRARRYGDLPGYGDMTMGK